MGPDAYRRLLEQLRDEVDADQRLRGLVAVGSTATGQRLPDSWSDHDVVVITRRGQAAAVRDDTSWLPNRRRVVVRFTEPDHGLTLLYDDGHLVEMAVCELDDLLRIPLGEHTVLAGDDEVVRVVGEAGRATSSAVAADDPDGSLGYHRFLKELVIGLNRFGRGELLSANERIRGIAVARLLASIARVVPPAPGTAAQRDGLDPHRRVEMTHPAIARRVHDAVGQPVPEVAAALLDVAESELVPYLPSAAPASITAARGVLARVAARGAH